VTGSIESSAHRPSEEPHRSDEAASDGGLLATLSAALHAQLPDLTARWSMQSRMVVLLDTRGFDGHDRPVQDSKVATDVVKALLDGLAAGDKELEAAITAGLRFGMEAFEQGVSLHHTGKAFDLLVAMTMYAMETEAARSDTLSGSVTDGIRLTRQLQRRAALISVALTRGYTQAYGKALRDQFRHLRHDLRNPLGTIKSILALMDDESVSLEARANPNFRIMAKRNARSLEEMIADRLSDDAAPLSTIVEREISLCTLANSVRRELRTEAEHRGVTVMIEASELRGRFDAAGLELLLRSTLHAALQESRTGEQIRLEFDDALGRKAAVRLSRGSGSAPIANRDTLEQLTALAERVGASATFSDRVLLSVPMRGSTPQPSIPAERERATMHDSIELGSGETPHDLRGAREGDHGQASVL
jgi:signal transduction histidine kinase